MLLPERGAPCGGPLVNNNSNSKSNYDCDYTMIYCIKFISSHLEKREQMDIAQVLTT